MIWKNRESILTFEGFHIHSSGVSTGNFEIVDAKLLSKLDKPELDLENGIVLDDEGSPFIKEYTPEGEGYADTLAMSMLRIMDSHRYLLSNL
ncbi:MAG: hypothetical protein ACOX43_07245 [Bacilli bacterium]